MNMITPQSATCILSSQSLTCISIFQSGHLPTSQPPSSQLPSPHLKSSTKTLNRNLRQGSDGGQWLPDSAVHVWVREHVTACACMCSSPSLAICSSVSPVDLYQNQRQACWAGWSCLQSRAPLVVRSPKPGQTYSSHSFL